MNNAIYIDQKPFGTHKNASCLCQRHTLSEAAVMTGAHAIAQQMTNTKRYASYECYALTVSVFYLHLKYRLNNATEGKLKKKNTQKRPYRSTFNQIYEEQPLSVCLPHPQIQKLSIHPP